MSDVEGSAASPGYLRRFIARSILWLNAAGYLLAAVASYAYVLFVISALGLLVYTKPMARVACICFAIGLVLFVAVATWWEGLTEWAKRCS